MGVSGHCACTHHVFRRVYVNSQLIIDSCGCPRSAALHMHSAREGLKAGRYGSVTAAKQQRDPQQHASRCLQIYSRTTKHC